MVVFVDLDGTLIDSLPLLYRVYSEFLQQYGVEASPEEFAEINGPSLQEGITLLQERYGIPGDAEALTQQCLEGIRAYYRKEVHLFPGAMNFLQVAQEQGARLALVTSSDAETAQHVLERTNIARYFEAVITPEGLANSKPNPAIYFKAMTVMDVQPHDCIAIEDAYNGVVAACAAGLMVIWMVREGQGCDFDGVIAQVHSWDEARALFL